MYVHVVHYFSQSQIFSAYTYQLCNSVALRVFYFSSRLLAHNWRWKWVSDPLGVSAFLHYFLFYRFQSSVSTFSVAVSSEDRLQNIELEDPENLPIVTFKWNHNYLRISKVLVLVAEFRVGFKHKLSSKTNSKSCKKWVIFKFPEILARSETLWLTFRHTVTRDESFPQRWENDL